MAIGNIKTPNMATYGVGALVLLFTVVLTIGIYFYNSYLIKENFKLQSQISEIEAEIAKINTDPNLQVFNLLDDNKNIIKKLKGYSQITRFISGINDLGATYGIDFSGFNYSNGLISSQANILGTSGGNSYAKLAGFIKEFRQDATSDFELEFISQVNGNNDLKLNTSFKVKENLPKKSIKDPSDSTPTINDSSSSKQKQKQNILNKINSINNEVNTTSLPQ